MLEVGQNVVMDVAGIENSHENSLYFIISKFTCMCSGWHAVIHFSCKNIFAWRSKNENFFANILLPGNTWFEYLETICLTPGHSSKVYRNFHHCKKPSKPHHMMLHINGKHMLRPNAAITNQTSLHLNNGMNDDKAALSSAEPQQANVNITSALVQSTISPQLKPEDTKLSPTLQMISQVFVSSHNGWWLQAFTLLDLGASVPHYSAFGSTTALVETSPTYSHIGFSGHGGRHQPAHNFLYSIQVSASIGPTLSGDLPLQFISEAKFWASLKISH